MHRPKIFTQRVHARGAQTQARKATRRRFVAPERTTPTVPAS